MQMLADQADQDGQERVEALITPAQKALLEKEAARRGLPLATFISESLARVAADVIEDDALIVLGSEDAVIMVEALLNPPAPGAVLRKAARRYGFVAGGADPAP